MGQSIIGIIIQSMLVGGALGYFICWIIEGPFNTIFFKRKLEEDISKAIENGHSVKAKLIRCGDRLVTSDRDDRTYDATYAYYLNGKKYTKTYRFKKRPSDEIILYWKKNPEKAETLDMFERKDSKRIIYIIICIIAVFIFKVLG